MKTLSTSIVLAAVLILLSAIIYSKSHHNQTASSSDSSGNIYEMANLGAAPSNEKATNAYSKLFIGTWRDSKDTNTWIRFLPDGKVMIQDEQTNVHLGSYTMVAQSNLLVIAQDTGTNSVPYYFPSQNEVVLRFPGENAFFKRDNPN